MRGTWGPAPSRAGVQRGGALLGRRCCVAVSAKLKYQTRIHQGHSKKSGWVEVNMDKLLLDSAFMPKRQTGPLSVKFTAGAPQLHCLRTACQA